MKKNQDNFLDITEEVCPMTFVKTRLFIDKLQSGAIATIRLAGEEPIQNVPASIRELGHAVLSIQPEEDKGSCSNSLIHHLIMQKN